jgi:hypothetical protein
VTKPKQEPEQNKNKKATEAKDAKEVAKKLLKTGAIKAIKKSLDKQKSKDEKVNIEDKSMYKHARSTDFSEHRWL